MKVKTPKEDPRIKSARESEERRADAAFIENTGQLLDEETRRRIRKFGNRNSARAAVRASGAGTTTGMGGSAASGGGIGSGGGGGSYDPGATTGGSSGSSSQQKQF